MFENRQVQHKEGLDLAEENNAIFVEISAKSNIGVKPLFHIISYKLGELYFDFPPKKDILDINGDFNEEKEEKEVKEVKEKKKSCCC